MVTPILIVLILLLPALGFSAVGGRDQFRRGAQIGAAAAFTFFGVGHFVMTDPMVAMLPDWVPHRVLLIYATGVLEFLIALGVLIPVTRPMAGWTAIAVLVAFFPANVYAALNHIEMGGHAWGPVYLLVRAPLQALLLSWMYLFIVRVKRK